MRRVLALGLLLAVLAPSGCGGKFPLPTETRKDVIPSDKSYQIQATWSGMDGVRDILLIQGQGPQLFVLFNYGGVGVAPRGELRSYARLKPSGTPPPIEGFSFPTLFNPVALCSGGDGLASANNRLYVLDAGDTCIARANPDDGSCERTATWNQRVVDYEHYWRVREFGLIGGDTLSTFTDTTVAWVQGIAADREGRVYVSGLAIVAVDDPVNPIIRTRAFEWQVRRYQRGPRYPGVFPPDPRMPGSNWHRDSTWVVVGGSGEGSVDDPRGIFWGPYQGGALYVADHGKDWVQKLSDVQSSSPLLGHLEGPVFRRFEGPEDVTTDLQGFLYVADPGNNRVLRFDASGDYIQRVDVEPDTLSLQAPIAVAADDSLVFIGDPGRGEVRRYKRRQ